MFGGPYLFNLCHLVCLAQEELKKYDQLKTDICANCERQAELLAVLAQQQAAFRSAFGFADWRRACEVRRAEAFR